ncbi:CLUMA_CG001531, isoform A [Clunio marinus]|uniref:CLUMA_CG001531, isoform A n=1 Tax=Clunio marinus TaxID=568069 RepID=A0A1J1HIA3_9DIPT|nr:CLUMA_CG001531, isoform A [Clunio marinus]
MSILLHNNSTNNWVIQPNCRQTVSFYLFISSKEIIVDVRQVISFDKNKCWEIKCFYLQNLFKEFETFAAAYDIM